jgi:AmiR/NasT family two-component response regulator
MAESTGGGVGVGDRSEVARIADLECQVATLQAALATNRVNGAAVGLLMAKLGLTREEGFRLLVTQSQHTNVKVADLALELVLTAETEAASRRRR